MPKVPYPYEVNGKLVTGHGFLIPICSLSLKFHKVKLVKFQSSKIGYLSFSAAVTPGAKVSGTEIPTQRAMRNPAKPLLKSMSRMVISIKVLARIYLTIQAFLDLCC